MSQFPTGNPARALMSLNIQVPGGRLIEFDELRSGDIEITVKVCKGWFRPGYVIESKTVIPSARRNLLADFLSLPRTEQIETHK